jgi:hypothetical protein
MRNHIIAEIMQISHVEDRRRLAQSNGSGEPDALDIQQDKVGDGGDSAVAVVPHHSARASAWLWPLVTPLAPVLWSLVTPLAPVYGPAAVHNLVGSGRWCANAIGWDLAGAISWDLAGAISWDLAGAGAIS